MTLYDLLTILAPTIAVLSGSVFGQFKRKQYYNDLHITLNSRLDQLLKTTKQQYFAKGKQSCEKKCTCKKVKTKKLV